MIAIITNNGWAVLDDDDPAGEGGNAIQDNFVQLAGIIDCTDIGTGTIALGDYNYTVPAGRTLDGRDVSVDGSKLDGIEAGADVTDATNVAAAGAAMAGGAFHDGFSDFVANKHIDWTSTASNFNTSGFVTGGNLAAFGGTVASQQQLLVSRTTADISSRYGIHVAFTPGATVTGTYHTRALSFTCAPYVATGITNSGSCASVRGENLCPAAHLGTLDSLFGVNFVVGHNTGAVGTTSVVAGIRVGPYHRNGTIGTFYGIYMASAEVGGTVTNKWFLYDENSWPSYHKGNLGIGSNTLPTANATSILFLGDNAAQPTMGSNTAGLYGYDPGTTTVELWAVDELGNDTQLSSHPFGGEFAPDPDEPLPYAVCHQNRLLGRKQIIDISRMARLLERQFGVQLVHDYTLPIEKTEKWQEIEAVRKEQWERQELEIRIQQAVEASAVEITEADAVEEIEVAAVEAVEIVATPARVIHRPVLKKNKIEIEIIQEKAKQEVRVKPEHALDESTGKFYKRRVQPGCERIGSRWVRRLTRDEAEARIEQPVYVPKTLPQWIAERLT